VNLFAAFNGCANDAQRGAVSAGSQRTGVAVGQHAAFIGQQRRTVRAHGLACLNVFFVHGVRLGQDLFFHFGHACARRLQLTEKALHAVDGPEKIYRRGPRSRQARANLIELRLKLCRCGCVTGLHPERDAVGRGDSNGGRTTHHHSDNHVSHLLVSCGENVALLKRELGLIDKANAFFGPGKGGNHATPV